MRSHPEPRAYWLDTFPERSPSVFRYKRRSGKPTSDGVTIKKKHGPIMLDCTIKKTHLYDVAQQKMPDIDDEEVGHFNGAYNHRRTMCALGTTSRLSTGFIKSIAHSNMFTPPSYQKRARPDISTSPEYQESSPRIQIHTRLRFQTRMPASFTRHECIPKFCKST